MKTLRFLSLLGALLALTGCPDNPCLGGIPPLEVSSTSTNIILVGEEVRLSLSPASQTDCDGNTLFPTPETLTVEIADPDNLAVENQSALGNPASRAATIQFTPEKQGRYHVFAAFDPSGGIQQFDLYSARNRSAEALLQTLPQTCKALERTRRGGWLCDSDFWRDGALVQRFTGYRLAAAGDVIWAVSPTQIMRFVDTGTGLDTPVVLNHAEGAARFLLASADELVILHEHTLQRILFDGTTLSSTGATFWEPGNGSVGPKSLTEILLRTGDQLATVVGKERTNFVVLDVCPFQLQAGRFVRTTASCQRLSTEVVGYEPAAVWTGSRFTFTDTFDDLRRMEWTGTELVEQASLPLGDSFKLTTDSAELRNTLTPVILPNRPPFISSGNRPTTLPVFSPVRRGILLEVLDTEMAEPRASPGLLWATSTPNPTGTRIRVRPSAP
jgi:hypothetical protein